MGWVRRSRPVDGQRRGQRKKLTAALQWQLDWGDKLKWLQEVAEETGDEPKALQSRPLVWEHLQFTWQAFWDLHTDRPMGMSVGPIPFTAIDRYADRYGIEGVDEFEAFRELIRAMDDAYLNWSAKRRDTPKP